MCKTHISLENSSFDKTLFNTSSQKHAQKTEIIQCTFCNYQLSVMVYDEKNILKFFFVIKKLKKCVSVRVFQFVVYTHIVLIHLLLKREW